MMKFEKKLYSIVLAVAMLFALVLPASAKSDDEPASRHSINHNISSSVVKQH